MSKAALLASAAQKREALVQAILREARDDLHYALKKNAFIIPRHFTVVCWGDASSADPFAITRSKAILNEAAARVEGELCVWWPHVSVKVINWWFPFSPRLYVDLGGL